MCHGSTLRDGTPVRLAYQVICYKCRASGPIARTAREAIAAWENHAKLRLVAPSLGQAPASAFEDFEEEQEESAVVG